MVTSRYCPDPLGIVLAAGHGPEQIRYETRLLSGAEAHSVTKRPNRMVILSQCARWRENPPDFPGAIRRALLPKAPISGILTPVTSVTGSE